MSMGGAAITAPPTFCRRLIRQYVAHLISRNRVSCLRLSRIVTRYSSDKTSAYRAISCLGAAFHSARNSLRSYFDCRISSRYRFARQKEKNG
jgi:hypothetical protein